MIAEAPIRSLRPPAECDRMFTAKIIMIAVAAMFLSFLPVPWLERRNFSKTLVKTLLTIGLIASVYVVVAGLMLLGDGWENPLAGADPGAVGKASTHARGKGGVVLLVIAFWPYVMIGSGGYLGWQYAAILRAR